MIINIELLEENIGQIPGLPQNPRKITDEKFIKLKENIQKYPEYLEHNSLKVYPHNGRYVIIGGNMRYKALKELGYTDIPCSVIQEDTDIEKLKAYTILDNNGFGKWDWAMLEDWDVESLEDWGLDLPIMESEINIDEFFNDIDNTIEKDKGEKIMILLPDEYIDQKSEIKTLIETALIEYKGIKIK